MWQEQEFDSLGRAAGRLVAAGEGLLSCGRRRKLFSGAAFVLEAHEVESLETAGQRLVAAWRQLLSRGRRSIWCSWTCFRVETAAGATV